MGFRWVWTALLLLVGCGGGGSVERDYASLEGSLVIPSAEAQRAPSMASAEFLEGSELAGTVDGTRVVRYVAEADGRLAPAVSGADLCLVSLDTGACGRTLDVAASEVVDIVISGTGRFALRLAGNGSGEEGAAALPDAYWDADPHRDGEIVVAPSPGWSAARIAALGGLQCVQEARGLCLLRAPADSGPSRDRLRRLLARCARLRETGAVRFAEPNYERRLAGTPDDSFFGQQWNLQQIHVQGLWDEGGEFSDAIVAIVDTGVAPGHSDLAGRFVDGWDFIDGDDDPTDETESQSHGTMVAGIAGAATNNMKGIAGIAWNGRMMPLRVFDAGGNANVFSIAQAIRYAAGLENASGRLPQRPAHVINLSFTGVVRTQSEEDACRAAHEAGSLVVAAVGNENTSRDRFPAAYPDVLGVGATTRDGARASYSNRGGQVALLAPGGTTADGVLVTDRNTDGQSIYRRVSGTSFAAPHVSAVAALLMELGSLDPDAVRALLEATARDLGAEGRDDDTGWGLVDAHAAVLALLELPAPAVFPGESLQVRLILVSTGEEVARATTRDVDGFTWTMAQVPAGTYRLVAGTDRDFDGAIDDAGELYGEWSGGDELAVERSAELTDLTITLSPR